jgi:hypothetical protein
VKGFGQNGNRGDQWLLIAFKAFTHRSCCVLRIEQGDQRTGVHQNHRRSFLRIAAITLLRASVDGPTA